VRHGEVDRRPRPGGAPAGRRSAPNPSSAVIVAMQFGAACSEIEHGVQSAVDTNQRRYLVNGEQSPINVRASAAPGVVTDRQPLIRHFEDDRGADHVSAQTKGVHLRSRQRGTSGFSGPDGRIHRDGRLGRAHFRQAGREFAGGPARCVDLAMETPRPVRGDDADDRARPRATVERRCMSAAAQGQALSAEHYSNQSSIS